MYSRQHLESPPPQSQFRRPWSPDPYDPLPSVRRSRNQQDDYLPQDNPYESHLDYSRYPQPPSQFQHAQRREPSDVSVEALDLADYARTLRPHRNLQPEPEPDILDSLHPPSLISRGGTLSSSSHGSSSRSPARRPFSLPPPSPRQSPYSSPYSSRNAPPTSYRSHNYPYLTQEPDIVTSPAHSEADITQFPAWSRRWYNPHDQAPMSPPDIYSPLPASHFDSKRSSAGVFDPNHTLKHGHQSYQFDSDPYSTLRSPDAYSNSHESTRELLPWSADPPEYGPTIDSSLKEERIRMLEREFGPNAKVPKKGAANDDFLDENGKPLVGTVDAKGNLITQGPKKRTATRVLQILCSMAAAIPSIYAALLIKSKDTAPPAGSIAAYVLYVVSVVTMVALLALFFFYPCCCRRNKGSGAGAASNPLANGMMVLPVQGLPGGKKNKKAKGRKGKKGKGAMQGGGDVQVNLIVDPHIFGGRREEEEDEEEGEEEGDGTWDWEGSSVPGGWSSSNGGANKKKRKRAKRRSVFVGLAMEEQWKKARSFAKKIMAFDIVGVFLWGAVFVVILLGKRCPIGGFNGWCNAYNVSSAAACLLCFFFGLSTFFDIKDLHTSKVSPRTRT